jgi:opacity protein-like surface antigen
MQTHKFILIPFAAVALWASTASAQETPVAASFGPHVGISKARGEDANVIGGAAFRLRLFPLLGVEGSIDYHKQDYGDALTVRSWPVQVTGMLYVLPVAYAAIGAGWYMTTFDYSSLPGVVLDDRTEHDFGWHFGGGVEFPLGTAATLVADLRYVFLNYDFQTVPGTDNVDSDFYMATAGVLFNL